MRSPRKRRSRTFLSTLPGPGRVVALALLAGLALCCADGAPDDAADMVLIGGRVFTGVVGEPWADALATKGDRILAVGSRSEIEALQGPGTVVHDTTGALIVAGFIDTHVHFLSGGIGLSSVQLRDAATPEEFARRIGAFAQSVPAGTWIVEGNWDHELWGGELPDRAWIDEATPDHPVWVMRLDGHMGLANSAALRAAGLLEATATLDVPGGEAVRDGDGRVTGVLKDNAMSLLASAIPEPSAETLDRALAAASDYVLAQGVTTVHHMGTWADLDVFERAEAAGELQLSVAACVPIDTWQRLAEKVKAEAPADKAARLRNTCLKGMVDGSLGSHTALFLEPYTDRPEDGVGLYVMPTDEIEQHALGADAAGLQVNVHAIGDRAIRELLDAFARIEQANGPRDRRFRIEHAQHIHPSDIPRFAEHGVLASMQPYHAIDDGRWATRVIGEERSETTYAFRALLDSGADVAFGSDWAVAPATPLEGIYAAVTRRTLDDANPEGWVPRQKIGIEEALLAYTTGGARAGFEENEKGTLEPGKRADVVVIDRDITALAPGDLEQLREAEVLLTVVGGEVAYQGGAP